MKRGEKIIGFLRAGRRGGQNAVLPFVKVALAADQHWTPDTSDLPKLLTEQILIALLDTGADASVIDADLASNLKLQIVGQVQTNYAGHLEATEIVHCQVCFVKERHIVGMNFASRTLRRSSDDFDVILGMDFLKAFDMNVSAQDNRVILNYLGGQDK